MLAIKDILNICKKCNLKFGMPDLTFLTLTHLLSHIRIPSGSQTIRALAKEGRTSHSNTHLHIFPLLSDNDASDYITINGGVKKNRSNKVCFIHSLLCCGPILHNGYIHIAICCKTFLYLLLAPFFRSVLVVFTLDC